MSTTFYNELLQKRKNCHTKECKTHKAINNDGKKTLCMVWGPGGGQFPFNIGVTKWVRAHFFASSASYLSSGVRDSAVHSHLKDKGQSYEDDNVHS